MKTHTVGRGNYLSEAQHEEEKNYLLQNQIKIFVYIFYIRLFPFVLKAIILLGCEISP
jgi:hypothetical protein